MSLRVKVETGMRRFRQVLAEAAAAFLLLNAGVNALAAVLALGGRWNPALDVLAHFATLYLGGAAVGALLGLATRGRARTAILALSAVAGAASATLMAPEFLRRGAPTAAAGPHAIRIVQYNALKSNLDVVREVDWLLSQRADIITIQEIRPDLAGELLARTSWAEPTVYGDVAIFSRLPRIAEAPPRRAAGSSLVIVHAAYAHPGGRIDVATLHLDWPTSRAHHRQQRDVAPFVRQRPAQRMILTGDFNAAPWSAALRRADTEMGLVRRDRALLTFPADRRGFRWPYPVLAIDHVYAGPGWATVRVERGPRLGSDHYPVVVTLAPVARR